MFVAGGKMIYSGLGGVREGSNGYLSGHATIWPLIPPHESSPFFYAGPVEAWLLKTDSVFDLDRAIFDVFWNWN